jgi:hypothetical protein
MSTTIRTSFLTEFVLVLVTAIKIVFPPTADRAISISTRVLAMLCDLVLLQLTEVVKLTKYILWLCKYMLPLELP